MALAFSRAVEEMIATRILLTATDGYVDITALGQGGGGGVVSVNARTVRLASENSFLNLGCSAGGDGRITLRAGGDGSAILLTTPKTGKTALHFHFFSFLPSDLLLNLLKIPNQVPENSRHFRLGFSSSFQQGLNIGRMNFAVTNI